MVGVRCFFNPGGLAFGSGVYPFTLNASKRLPRVLKPQQTQQEICQDSSGVARLALKLTQGCRQEARASTASAPILAGAEGHATRCSPGPPQHPPHPPCSMGGTPTSDMSPAVPPSYCARCLAYPLPTLDLDLEAPPLAHEVQVVRGAGAGVHHALEQVVFEGEHLAWGVGGRGGR